MTKTVSIVILSVICAIALFFGVCSCLPGGQEIGEYDIYNAPINLIQGSGVISDSVVTTYKVTLNEDSTSDINQVASQVRARLGNIYGRWFCNVVANEADKTITVSVPKTAREDAVSEISILSSVTSVGKVEISNESSYSESKVVLTAEHVKNVKLQRFAYGSTTYHIVLMTLTNEGKQIANDKLVSSSSWDAYLYIDGTACGWIQLTNNGDLQIYTNSDQDSQRIYGLTKSGELSGKLVSLSTEDKSCVGGLVFGIVCAVIVLGSWIFYAVRYRALSLAAILSQLIAIVAFIMFSGMVYFSYLNTASAIGIILGYGLMSTFTCLVFEKIRAYLSEKTFASARYRAFADNNKWNCIVHAIVLVVGIILWLIPTGVTVPLGNALVYFAVLSFVVTMGLNRLFTSMVYPIGKDNVANYGVKVEAK